MTMQTIARVPHRGAAALAAAAVVGAVVCSLSASQAVRQAAPIGTWRGTSTCSDRVALPGCHDEVVAYEFTAGVQSGTVHWKADKIVNGQREADGRDGPDV